MFLNVRKVENLKSNQEDLELEGESYEWFS